MTRATETEQERVDRNLGQLMEGLRVAMPGVQVLFAFLLTVPFQSRFEELSTFQERVYFVTLLAAAAASALFIAPTAYHRLLFRLGEKERLVFLATKLVIAGLAALAVAMVGSVLLITDLLFTPATVVLVIVPVAALFAGLWFAWPLWRRRSRGSDGA
jgi:hypothetical protein